jgi:hypothetical protein
MEMMKYTDNVANEVKLLMFPKSKSPAIAPPLPQTAQLGLAPLALQPNLAGLVIIYQKFPSTLNFNNSPSP